jgi:hypothetical protein
MYWLDRHIFQHRWPGLAGWCRFELWQFGRYGFTWKETREFVEP